MARTGRGVVGVLRAGIPWVLISGAALTVMGRLVDDLHLSELFTGVILHWRAVTRQIWHDLLSVISVSFDLNWNLDAIAALWAVLDGLTFFVMVILITINGVIFEAILKNREERVADFSNDTIFNLSFAALTLIAGVFVWPYATMMGNASATDQMNVEAARGVLAFMLLLYMGLAYGFARGGRESWLQMGKNQSVAAELGLNLGIVVMIAVFIWLWDVATGFWIVGGLFKWSQAFVSGVALIGAFATGFLMALRFNAMAFPRMVVFIVAVIVADKAVPFLTPVAEYLQGIVDRAAEAPAAPL